MATFTIPTSEATIDTTNYILSDIPSQKIAFVVFTKTPIRLVLWSGDEYTAAGDYSQAEVDARITELLGEDPAAKLASLVPKRPF